MAITVLIWEPQAKDAVKNSPSAAQKIQELGRVSVNRGQIGGHEYLTAYLQTNTVGGAEGDIEIDFSAKFARVRGCLAVNNAENPISVFLAQSAVDPTNPAKFIIKGLTGKVSPLNSEPNSYVLTVIGERLDEPGN